MKLDNLQDVFVDVLKDLYSAETQLIKALPKMAKAATTPQLKQGFKQHLATTRTQADRLKKITTMLGERPTGKTCVGMKGLIKEGQEVISEKGDPAATDAALIVAAQKIEHYEIAGYGSAKTFATLLGHSQAAKLLSQTLEEEKKTDHKLTEVAESKVNFEAEEHTGKKASAARKKPAARSAKGRKTTKAASSRTTSAARKKASAAGGRASSRKKTTTASARTAARKKAAAAGGRATARKKSTASPRSASPRKSTATKKSGGRAKAKTSRRK